MESKKNHLNHPFRFTFKLVEENQIPLVHQWLAQEHIHEWLHGVGLQNTLEQLEKFFKGTSWGQHWIAYDKEFPFGYLLTSEEGPDAITLDLFICDLNYLGKGLGVQMIHEFLLSQFSHIKQVLIDPELTNTRAIHVYKKAGFKIIDEFIASWHPVPHYKMKLEIGVLHNFYPGFKVK
jgi:RimJ/RimL family protein N-acetyltransferase